MHVVCLLYLMFKILMVLVNIQTFYYFLIIILLTNNILSYIIFLVFELLTCFPRVFNTLKLLFISSKTKEYTTDCVNV